MPKIINASTLSVTVRVSKTGYKTKTVTEVAKVSKAEGQIKLSSLSGTYTYPTSGTFTISENTGTISATSNNTNYNKKTVTYAVTVNYQTFTGNSGVGYYADVDGNETVDGIIFEDFKVGGSGKWDNVSYTIPNVSNTKSYRVSQKNYSGPLGTKDVLAPIGSENDRFYVMALNDYSGSNNFGRYVRLAVTF